jgi:hypothetical protein
VISLTLVEIILLFVIVIIPFTDRHALRHDKDITYIRWYLSRPVFYLAVFILFRLYAPRPKYWRLMRLFVFLSRLSTHIKYVPQPEEDGCVCIHYEEL